MVVYICNVCNLYIFDESQGDSKYNIAANSTIDDISDSWRCPVCEAKKDALKELLEGGVTAAKKKYQKSLVTSSTPKGKQLTILFFMTARSNKWPQRALRG